MYTGLSRRMIGSYFRLPVCWESVMNKLDMWNIPSSSDGSLIPALMVAQRMIATHPEFVIRLMDNECQSNVEFSSAYYKTWAAIDDELRFLECADHHAMIEMYQHEDYNADFMLDI